jgi:hypothetical protein
MILSSQQNKEVKTMESISLGFGLFLTGSVITVIYVALSIKIYIDGLHEELRRLRKKERSREEARRRKRDHFPSGAFTGLYDDA